MYTSNLSRLIVTTTLLLVTLLVSCAPATTPQPTNTPELPTAASNLKQALVGNWTSTVTKEDILQVMPDFHQAALCDNTGTFIWRFNANGTFTVDQAALPECPIPTNTHFEDKWVLDGNQITFAKGTPEEEIYEIAIDGDKLTFKAVSSECPPCIAVNTANPWIRVQ